MAVGVRTPFVSVSRQHVCANRRLSRRGVYIVRAENDSKVVREYREDDDQLIEPGKKNTAAAKSQVGKGGTAYIDELPEVQREPMSKEFQKRLRDEYVGLGGSPNTPMGGNYFLYISIAIAVLALLSWITGAI